MEDLIPELIAAVVVPTLGALVVAVRAWLQTKLTPERLTTVAQLARVAVDAADEVGLAFDKESENDSLPGDAKYKAAAQFLVESAKRVGIKLTETEASVFIHSTLYGKRNEVERLVDEVLDDILGNVLHSDDEAPVEEAPY